MRTANGLDLNVDKTNITKVTGNKSSQYGFMLFVKKSNSVEKLVAHLNGKNRTAHVIPKLSRIYYAVGSMFHNNTNTVESFFFFFFFGYFRTIMQWYSTFFPPVPLQTLFHSTLYPQSCWCIIQVIYNYI
jgi:hypothetical protein